MLEGLTKGTKQFWTVYQGLPGAKKFGVAAALVVVMAGFAAILFFTGQPDYQVLYSNLTQGDAAQVVDKLQEKKIPYKLADQGRTVLVQAEQLFETRLSLAGEGLPQGGGVGFEVFDRSQMGATDFVQRINYQRAIQGELARTISQFKEVAYARVHLVTPKESLFIEEQKHPTAAVVLQMEQGADLNPTQVQAIVNLVAGSVEGLEKDHVSVVDTTGRVLFDKKDETQLAGLTQTQVDHKQRVEAGLVAKIQSLLDRVVGPGRSIAKVSAEIDFDQEKRVEEEYDPDVSVVRSSQSTEEEQQGQSTRPTGSPDDQFKVTPQAGGTAGASNNYTRTNETVNYEINRINRQVVKAFGGLERLSVAVIIDGRYEEKPGAGGGQPVRTYVPRSDEELVRFTSLIKSAVGYSETRGDVVEVSTMPFEAPAAIPEIAPGIVDQIMTFLRLHGRTLLVILLAALFFLLVVRPMLKWTGRELKDVTVESAKLAAPTDPLAGELEDLRRKQGPREKAAYLAEKEPQMAIGLVRAWLHEGSIKR